MKEKRKTSTIITMVVSLKNGVTQLPREIGVETSRDNGEG